MKVVRAAAGRGARTTRKLHLSDEIATGGEGVVYEVTEDSGLAAKIYHEPDEVDARRLRSLLATDAESWLVGNDHVALTWPICTLLAPDGERVVGYLMYRLPPGSGFPLLHVLDPAARRRDYGEVGWGFMVTVAAELAALVAQLHDRGYVVGDLGDRNAYATRRGRVTLIDCTSMQFRGPDSKLFTCPVTTPDYCPPELFEADLGALERAPSSDDFSLAILVCRLLMEGNHPFDGVPRGRDDGDDSIARNISRQDTRFLHAERLHLRADLLPLEILPPKVRTLAHRCFGEGHERPDRRPTAAEWAGVLEATRSELEFCGRNALHAFHRSIATCPWCGRVEDGFGDHYPPIEVVLERPPKVTPSRKPTSGPPDRGASPSPPVLPSPPPPSRPSPPKPRPAPPRPRPSPPPRAPVPAGQRGGPGLGVWIWLVTVAAVLILLYLVSNPG